MIEEKKILLSFSFAHLHKQPNAAISTTRENPWLARMEAHAEHCLTINDRVAAKNLHWNNHRIAHQVAVNHSMEHVHAALVAARRKERE